MDIQRINQLLLYINIAHNEGFTLSDVLEGGYQDGAALVIDKTGKRFILKQWYRQEASPILAILEQRGYPSKAPISAGQTPHGEQYWIQEYLPGRQMGILQEQYVEQIEAINQLQADCIPLPLQSVGANWSRYAYQVVFHNESGWFETLRTVSAEVALFVETLRRQVQAWENTVLPQTDAVHGDFTPDNMVVEENRITGVIDTTAMGYGTRAIDIATLLHYAYLYQYSDAVKQRLHGYITNHFDKGTIQITAAYRILAMLAWAAKHDSQETVKQSIERSSQFLVDIG